MTRNALRQVTMSLHFVFVPEAAELVHSDPESLQLVFCLRIDNMKRLEFAKTKPLGFLRPRDKAVNVLAEELITKRADECDYGFCPVLSISVEILVLQVHSRMSVIVRPFAKFYFYKLQTFFGSYNVIGHGTNSFYGVRV